MRATTAAKTEIKTEARPSFGVTLLVITFRIAIIFTMIVLVTVSAWAILALMGGLTATGDPITMVAEWFKAVTGT